MAYNIVPKDLKVAVTISEELAAATLSSISHRNQNLVDHEWAGDCYVQTVVLQQLTKGENVWYRQKIETLVP
jgi:hypothetical protein